MGKVLGLENITDTKLESKNNTIYAETDSSIGLSSENEIMVQLTEMTEYNLKNPTIVRMSLEKAGRSVFTFEQNVTFMHERIRRKPHEFRAPVKPYYLNFPD